MEEKQAPIDEEVRDRLVADQERLDKIELRNQEDPQVTDPTSTTSAAQPKEEPKAEKEEPTEEGDQPNLYDTAVDALDTIGEGLQTAREQVMSPAAGTVDFLIDAANQVQGVDLPKYPKFQSEYAQASRELSSFIVPTLLLTRGLGAAGKAANAKANLAIGKNALVKMFGAAGVDIGSGVVVDYINANTAEGDNVQGTLKKLFPKTFSWISDDWATIDGDSPELKRAKSINEGVGLGMMTSFLEAAGTLLRGIKGTKKVTSYIPESESAKAFFEKNVKNSGDTPEEVFSNSIKSQEEALDEIAAYQVSKSTDLDQPMLGVHDAFDLDEAGVRSIDNLGVIGASVDAVRTQKNLGSYYGRLGSVVTEGALKYGLDAGDLTKRSVVKMIKDAIRKGGEYSAELASGRKITFAEIDEAGTNLADILSDPRMDTGTIKATLDEFKDEYDKLSGKAKSLGDVGYNAAMKTIKKYLDDYVNMDLEKASAYLTTSLAGQMSDIAEGARYMEGTEAVGRAQEMVLDRLEYLMVEKGLAAYNKGASLNFLNTWKRISDNPKELNAAGQEVAEQTDQALARIVNRAKNSANSLRNIAKERPEYLVPLQMAWEFSDGNIDTLSKLHNFVDQSLPNIEKAFYDGQPRIPNQIVQGAWSNIYNSVLTSISTPMKAAFGNSALMLLKPITVFGGAVMGGDIKTLRRGWHQYSGVMESMQKGFSHMSAVYRKAATDPNSVGYIMRDDLVQRNEATMDILHSFARAAESKGNSGPLALYHMAETLHDLGNNPVLRFGANAMTALDGFTRAVIANSEARVRAYDRFVVGGKELNGKTLKEAHDDIYNQMFDKTGMITDKAVDHASREIALNLDNELVDGLSMLIERAKFTKPFLMFPRTSANMIAMTNKYSPISLFMDDVNKLAGYNKQFTAEEVVDIMTSRGFKPEEITMEAFDQLRAEVRGRKAIGTMTVMGAVGLFMNDRLRGNGHFDKERQRVRNEVNWKPRTYMGTDGKWYSYDGLGPISDYLALTADVMDNFDSITENDLETWLNKMGFIISANLTNKSFLAGLEPMNDVLAGNPAALNRWASSFVSSFAPLSSARNELGRLIAPQLRELDMEFTQLLRNRNKWTDAVNPKGSLPNKYDWIDGKPVGYAEGFFVRGWNAVMPMKVSDGISEERQFLLDIEYDSRPMFNKNNGGIEYTPEERSELFSIMGRQGYLKKRIREIMGTVTAKEWRKEIREERTRNGKADPTKWRNLYSALDTAIRDAKEQAEVVLSNANEIEQAQYEYGVNEAFQRKGQAQPFPLTNR